ncbi:MAG: hypothetical protein GEV03_11040 [Streptosporangiales bacterium]|nr:hypothetical protein [Streptosporangiales bacterium]
MSSSTELPPESAVLPRVGALCRALLQVRLFLAALTLLGMLGRTVTLSFLLAFAGAVFSSWLASHYWDRLAPRLARHPILGGLDVVISYGILSLGGPLGPFFLFTVVTAALAGLLYRWRGVTYICALQVLFYYGALATAGIGPANWSFQTLIGQPAYYPVVGFVGVAIRRLLDEQDRTEEARRNAEVAAAAAEERARLAREMHDSLAKTLRGIAMAATALPAWLERSTERAAREARGLASAAEVASREARGLITHLRSDQLDRPLGDAVQKIATEWSRMTEIPVTLDCAAHVELPLMCRYEAVAILREALTNIERHADAFSVRVCLRRDGDRVALEVADDGRGFAPGPDTEDWPDDLARRGHYGLVGMHERATRADGTFSISSAPGAGTRVVAVLPAGASAPTHQQEAKNPAESG